MTDPKYRWSIQKYEGTDPYHDEDESVWTWFRSHEEFDSFDPQFKETVVEPLGCVCHTPGPIDWFYRQPRLQRYCTAKGCQDWAIYAVFPKLTHHEGPSQYACERHLEHLDATFKGLPIWMDFRETNSEPPQWQPMFLGNGPLDRTVDA